MIYMIYTLPSFVVNQCFGNENLINLILAGVMMLIMAAGEKINLIHSLVFYLKDME